MFNKLSRRAGSGVALTMAAALMLTACGGNGGGEAGGTPDPNEEVTLNFTWWGNEDRAERYNEAIALFEEQNPNIDVNGTFMDFPAYWEKRQTEAAGGGLPDVMQFDYSYLRQYGQNGLLMDLTEYVGNGLTTDTIDETLLATGKLEDQTLAVPTGYNAWSLFENPALIEQAGVEGYEGGTSWEDYEAYMASVSEAGDEIWGGTDYTGRIQNFELQLRQEGRELFTEDGQLNFTQEELGASLGVPASETALEGAALEGPELEVKEYLDSVSDRIGEPPAAPIVGYGALENTFLTLGTSIGLDAITPEEPAQQFFDEAAVTLGS